MKGNCIVTGASTKWLVNHLGQKDALDAHIAADNFIKKANI